MPWQSFNASSSDDPDAPEIAYATMLGGVFRYHDDRWRCFDETRLSGYDQTGTWSRKANAARAFLASKRLHVSEDGQTISKKR
jgi:hypothetical protein